MVKPKTLLALALVWSLGWVAAGPAFGENLKFGIFADASSLPFVVADAEGLFAAQGLKVDILLFQSAVERDAAFQAGKVDGTIGDFLAAGMAVDKGFAVKVTSVSAGRFGLVAAPGSSVKSLKDLAGQPIGVSLHTIIHYFVDTSLTGAGVAADKINYLSVPKLPIRLEMVSGGQLPAASLPEPFLTVAQTRGAQVLATSEGDPSAASVVLFSEAYLKDHRAVLKAFFAAYDAAVAKINANPNAYRDYLVTKLRFPAEIRDAYRFDVYEPAHLPSAAAVDKVMGWLYAQKLTAKLVKADQLLN
jgi:NitT/TauT family transport system substrate-binding protein